MNKTAWILIVVVVLGAYQYSRDRVIAQAPGILVTGDPLQVNYETPGRPIAVKDAVLDPLASFDIRARVLAIRRYWFDHFSKLAPLDFALGWGVMSDSKVLEQLNISQADRFYFYDWSGPHPADPQLMAQSSANVHLIPANDLIKKQLSRIHVGQVIHMKGQLVRVNYLDGKEIVSSLIRTDTGGGACEVIWVTAVD